MLVEKYMKLMPNAKYGTKRVPNFTTIQKHIKRKVPINHSAPSGVCLDTDVLFIYQLRNLRWSFVYSGYTKMYIYRGGDGSKDSMKKGWQIQTITQPILPKSEYVEKSYPISELNGGKGWNFGINKKYPIYVLYTPHVYQFMNWLIRNPMEVKE